MSTADIERLRKALQGQQVQVPVPAPPPPAKEPAGLEYDHPQTPDPKLHSALILSALMFLSFFVLTVNYRSVAVGSYLGTAVTDVIICLLNWSILKRVQEAEHWYERIGYILGGVAGAQVAIYVTASVLK